MPTRAADVARAKVSVSSVPTTRSTDVRATWPVRELCKNRFGSGLPEVGGLCFPGNEQQPEPYRGTEIVPEEVHFILSLHCKCHFQLENAPPSDIVLHQS